MEITIIVIEWNDEQLVVNVDDIRKNVIMDLYEQNHIHHRLIINHLLQIIIRTTIAVRRKKEISTIWQCYHRKNTIQITMEDNNNKDNQNQPIFLLHQIIHLQQLHHPLPPHPLHKRHQYY